MKTKILFLFVVVVMMAGGCTRPPTFHTDHSIDFVDFNRLYRGEEFKQAAHLRDLEVMLYAAELYDYRRMLYDVLGETEIFEDNVPVVETTLAVDAGQTARLPYRLYVVVNPKRLLLGREICKDMIPSISARHRDQMAQVQVVFCRSDKALVEVIGLVANPHKTVGNLYKGQGYPLKRRLKNKRSESEEAAQQRYAKVYNPYDAKTNVLGNRMKSNAHRLFHGDYYDRKDPMPGMGHGQDPYTRFAPFMKEIVHLLLTPPEDMLDDNPFNRGDVWARGNANYNEENSRFSNKGTSSSKTRKNPEYQRERDRKWWRENEKK